MVSPQKSTNISDELAGIVGSGYFFDQPETLEAYSKDESFVMPRKPWAVVKPKNTDKVQAVLNWANQNAIPLVPVSSGAPHFRGDTVPSVPGAVVVDLSDMKRVHNIDRRNRMAVIEPGVTFRQLNSELAREGLTVSMPLIPRNSKSVVTSFLEREPIVIPKYHWAMPEPLRCCEIIWGNGEKLWTGEAGDWPDPIELQWKKLILQISPLGPHQVDYYRLVSAAQGSMGIVTRASIRCQILPQIHKLLLATSESLEPLLDVAYKILRFRYGYELFILNNLNLASIMGKDANQIRALKNEIPTWILILGIAGLDRLPRERVAFQEEDITDIARQFDLKLLPTVPGISSEQLMETMLIPPDEPYWKLKYKGGCHDIFFITTLDRSPEFIKTMHSFSLANYPSSEMGVYIQPVTQGTACHCEFNLPFSPENQPEINNVKKLITEGSETLMKTGAFFSRPYGSWAGMVYGGDSQTTSVLKKVKGIFDPNNVLNPGKLCF